MERDLAPSLTHLERMCGVHGIVQFCSGNEPDLDSGYCLDDNVRLLVLAVSILEDDRSNAFALEAGNSVFDFIAQASAGAPVYHNMMDQHGRFTDRFASPESIGRLINALGVVMRDSHEPT